MAMIIAPDFVQSTFGFPAEDPVVFGITASVYTAFALLSILGLKSPLKFAPVLLLQLVYKSVWLAGIVLPMLISGRFPAYATTVLIIFVSYIIGDLIAIPFALVFSDESTTDRQSGLHQGPPKMD